MWRYLNPDGIIVFNICVQEVKSTLNIADRINSEPVSQACERFSWPYENKIALMVDWIYILIINSNTKQVETISLEKNTRI